MLELAVCVILIFVGIIFSYFFYRSLVWDAELSKAFYDLNQDTIKVSVILNNLRKGKDGKGE